MTDGFVAGSTTSKRAAMGVATREAQRGQRAAPGDEGTRADTPRSVAKAVRPRRPGIVLSRSAQGAQRVWLALSGPSAVVVGAAGADLDCCVSGELLFCQTRDGGRAETPGSRSIGQKCWEAADGGMQRL